MKKAIYGLVSLSVLATTVSCGASKTGETKSGATYEFYTGKPGNSLEEGDLLTLDFKFKIGDSVLNSSQQIEQSQGKAFTYSLPALDSATYFDGPAPIDGLYMLNKGDSAVFRMGSKTFFEKIGQPAPEWIKETDTFFWEMKLVDVVTSKSVAEKNAALRKIDPNFLKTDKNLEYKFIELGKSDRPSKVGDVFELNMIQKIGDSVVMNTLAQQGAPISQPLVQAQEEYDVMSGLALMRAGDKAIFRIPLADLFAKGMPKQEWMKEGDYISFEIDVVSVKSAKEIKDEAAAKEKAAASNDDKAIQDYLKAANITNFKKTESGLYYVIHTPGTGDNAKKGQTVSVNYTGKLLDGKVFDSNIDPKFNHVEPFNVPAGAGQVIKGWDEALMLMNKGTKATVYIPSNLGYGSRAMGTDIPANSILIFDMEILDIK